MAQNGMPEGYRVLHVEEIDSTNSEAARRGENGEAGPLWIRADRQTAGRGRRGREWVSPSGNLLCTLLLTDQSSAEASARYSFVAALAVAEMVSFFVGEGPAEVGLKWPNDVLLRGKKIAGILLESGQRKRSDGSGLYLAVGIGVNLASHPSATRWPATSLKEAGFSVPAPEAALNRLALAFDRWRQTLEDNGFEPVRQAWLAAAQGVGQDIEVRLGDKLLKGRFKDLDSTGALVLELEDGRQTQVHSGEVYFGNTGQREG